MKVLQYPHPKLLNPCEDVQVFDNVLLSQLNSMWDLMLKEKGLGLSANQVGLNLRMFVMHGPNSEKLFVINPIIVERSKNISNLSEGCLSAPGDSIVLYRSNWIKINFKDHLGNEHNRVFSDIYSVCVQHELDHLSGIAFFQNRNVPKVIRNKLERKWGLK